MMKLCKQNIVSRFSWQSYRQRNVKNDLSVSRKLIRTKSKAPIGSKLFHQVWIYTFLSESQVYQKLNKGHQTKIYHFVRKTKTKWIFIVKWRIYVEKGRSKQKYNEVQPDNGQWAFVFLFCSALLSTSMMSRKKSLFINRRKKKSSQRILLLVGDYFCFSSIPSKHRKGTATHRTCNKRRTNISTMTAHMTTTISSAYTGGENHLCCLFSHTATPSSRNIIIFIIVLGFLLAHGVIVAHCKFWRSEEKEK